MGSILRKAELELDILSKNSTDPNNRPLIEPFRDELLSLVKKFGESGQSGGSAPYTASALSHAVKTLCLQQPIGAITGIDEEWSNEISGGKMYQNQRCYGVFKTGEEVKYVDAIVWKTQTGSTWSGRAISKSGERIGSTQLIKSFPFIPKTFVVDVIEKEVEPDNWEFYIKEENQIEEVFKYYDKITDKLDE